MRISQGESSEARKWPRPTASGMVFSCDSSRNAYRYSF